MSAQRIPDEDPSGPSTLPLPLSASIVLTSLPRDAHSALERAVREQDGVLGEDGGGVPRKVTIRFQPIGSAPQLKQKIFKISSSNNFSTVVGFLRKRLFDQRGRVVSAGDSAVEKGKGGHGEGGNGNGERGGGGGGQSVFCYVNSVFAPGLDEGVGGLWRGGGRGWKSGVWPFGRRDFTVVPDADADADEEDSASRRTTN